MSVRSRNFDNRSPFSGTYQNLSLGTTVTRSLDTGLNGTCDDVIGNFPTANGLSITRLNRQYPGLDGTRYNAVTGVPERRMTNFPLGSHPGPVDPRSIFPALTNLEKSNYAWSILSKANPSAPDVSLATTLLELKDIPSLMRSWYGLLSRRPRSFIEGNWKNFWWTKRGDLQYRGYLPPQWALILARTPEIIASGHLTWRWAVAPFIRDMRKLLDLQFLVARRVAELRRLFTGKTLKRRVQLGRNASISHVGNQILHSEGLVIKGTRTVNYLERVWGTVKYKALYKLNVEALHNEDTLRQKAYNLVTGITTHEALATAWELMPWSWLVDWFLQIGTVISATNNSLDLVHSDCCLMRHTSSETTISIDKAASETWAIPNRDYLESYERKERFVVAPVLPFAPTYLPIFSRKAELILGSLLISRVRPGDTLQRSLTKLLYRR